MQQGCHGLEAMSGSPESKCLQANPPWSGNKQKPGDGSKWLVKIYVTQPGNPNYEQDDRIAKVQRLCFLWALNSRGYIHHHHSNTANEISFSVASMKLPTNQRSFNIFTNTICKTLVFNALLINQFYLVFFFFCLFYLSVRRVILKD